MGGGHSGSGEEEGKGPRMMNASMAGAAVYIAGHEPMVGGRGTDSWR